MKKHDEARDASPQGRFLGLPYDLRVPTVSRFRTRLWNPDDPRLFTPKTFGWGYDVNAYWLFHPARLFRTRRRFR